MSRFLFQKTTVGIARLLAKTVATAAVLPCRHLVAMTYEVVDVPERESINLTGTRLSTYIPC